MYSALDAYIRHFDVIVAADAVAHIDGELGHAALQMMEREHGRPPRRRRRLPGLSTRRRVVTETAAGVGSPVSRP